MRYVILWSVLLLAGYASAASPPAGDRPESSAAAEGSKSDFPATEGGTRLTVREIDIFRRQIGKCWMPPLNAPNTEEFVVDVRIEVSRARTVKRVTVVDSARMKTDSYFHAMAASAVRVFRHPDCSHLRLPPEKYETWKVITLHFDPSKMVRRK